MHAACCYGWTSAVFVDLSYRRLLLSPDREPSAAGVPAVWKFPANCPSKKLAQFNIPAELTLGY